jgi:hypothetical protein
VLSILNWIAVLLLIASTTGLFLSRDWRWLLAILALQYVAVAWLIQANLPAMMAVAKLVTGWTACITLGMTQISRNRIDSEDRTGSQNLMLRTVAIAIVAAVSLALSYRTTTWLGMSLPVAWASLLLMGAGLLFLGMTAQPVRVIIAMLTFLSGFEILYATVENSLLVATMLAVVTLGMALVGAFLIDTSDPGLEK